MNEAAAKDDDTRLGLAKAAMDTGLGYFTAMSTKRDTSKLAADLQPIIVFLQGLGYTDEQVIAEITALYARRHHVTKRRRVLIVDAVLRANDAVLRAYLQ